MLYNYILNTLDDPRLQATCESFIHCDKKANPTDVDFKCETEEEKNTGCISNTNTVTVLILLHINIKSGV